MEVKAVVNFLSPIQFFPNVSDPNVKRFNLKSYLGYPILCDHHVIGSLAGIDTQVRQFDDTDTRY